MTRTDHAAEARRLIELASIQPDTDSALAVSHAAQVHATLALADQRRIANLIALAESGRATLNGSRRALSALYDGAPDQGAANMSLRPDVARALGIADGADR